MSANKARTARRARDRARAQIEGAAPLEEGAEITETPPAPLAKGRYALYELPNGDGLLAYRPEPEEEDRHQVIPGGIWKILMSLARGEKPEINPMLLMKAMMNR